MIERARICRRRNFHIEYKPYTMLQSALMNVMIKAARRAGRSLKRDLGEIEHLQVSVKGPRNFVTAADHRAERFLRRMRAVVCALCLRSPRPPEAPVRLVGRATRR